MKSANPFPDIFDVWRYWLASGLEWFNLPVTKEWARRNEKWIQRSSEMTIQMRPPMWMAAIKKRKMVHFCCTVKSKRLILASKRCQFNPFALWRFYLPSFWYFVQRKWFFISRKIQNIAENAASENQPEFMSKRFFLKLYQDNIFRNWVSKVHKHLRVYHQHKTKDSPG